MSNEEFDLDEVEVREDTSAFKVEKDHKYRVGFPLLNKNGRIKIVKVDYFAFEDADEKFHSWQKSEDESLNKAAIEKGADEKSHFVTVMIVYRTDKSGKILKPLSYDLMPVKLADKKIKNLKEINAEWDLTSVDLSLTSPNPAYQEHQYTPLKTAIWRAKKGDDTLSKVGADAPIEKEVLEAAAKVAENMTEVVAYSKSDAQIRGILGLTSTDSEGAVEGKGVDLDEEFEGLSDDDL